MPEPIRKEVKVELTQNPPKKESQKKVKKKVPSKSWNFPLEQRSVKARTLAEARKIINAKG